MPWNGAISWSNGDLVASSKLVDMVENEDWAKGLVDRLLMASVPYGPFAREDSYTLAGWEADITLGGETKTASGSSTGSFIRKDWDVSTMSGDFGNHTIDVLFVLRQQMSGDVMRQIIANSHRVTLPNEDGIVRYTNVTILGRVSESYWVYDIVGPEYRRGLSFFFDVWAHNNDWSDDWSPEV